MGAAEAALRDPEILANLNFSIAIGGEFNILKAIDLRIQRSNSGIKFRPRENFAAAGAKHAIEPTVQLQDLV
jgi:hypothetical protein